MGWSQRGIYMLAAMKEGKLTPEIGSAIYRALVDSPLVRPLAEESLVAVGPFIARGDLSHVRYAWDDWLPITIPRPATHPPEGTLHISGFASTQGPTFEWGERTIREFYSYNDALPPEEPQKVAFILERFHAAINVMQPEYALIDHFGKTSSNPTDARWTSAASHGAPPSTAPTS